VFDPQRNAEAHQRAHALRSEHVIAVRGEVRLRPDGMTNYKLKTGEIEVIVDEYRLLNTSLTPPFQLEPEVDAGENLRLRYRFLDLRYRGRNPGVDQKHTRRGSRLPRSQPG
jgi:aspartyl-tRNA synthetase